MRCDFMNGCIEEFVAVTGYARKYARWLLNHIEEVFMSPTALRRRYGPEVEGALVRAWTTLNRICAKRLIPFLPDLLETLEEEGHAQLSKDSFLSPVFSFFLSSA